MAGGAVYFSFDVDIDHGAGFFEHEYTIHVNGVVRLHFFCSVEIQELIL